MGQVKKISKNELQRIAGVSGKQYKTIQWHNNSLILKQFLDINTYIETVNSIIEDCKAPDGTIIASLVPFSTRLHIIMSYSFVELPDAFDELYYVVYNSDLYDVVCKNVNQPQIDSIINSVNTICGR